MSPERTDIRTALLRKRARRALNRAGIKVGGDHIIGPVVEAIQIECEATRDRLAGMVERVMGRGTITDAHLERLAWVMRTHWIDEDGEEQIDEDGAP